MNTTDPHETSPESTFTPRLSDFPEPMVRVSDYKQKAPHKASRTLKARHPSADAEVHGAWYWKKMSQESIARILASQK